MRGKQIISMAMAISLVAGILLPVTATAFETEPVQQVTVGETAPQETALPTEETSVPTETSVPATEEGAPVEMAAEEVSSSAASGSCGDELTWVWEETSGTLTISGEGPMDIGPENQAPWYAYRVQISSVIIEHGVTGIAPYAFRDCINLQSLSLPDTLGSIGDYAFCHCSALTSVTIPGSLTSLGTDAFKDCCGLTAVYISDLAQWCRISFDNHEANPLYQARNLYWNGSLVEDLVIPEGVTGINPYVFTYCRSLKGVALPESLTEIGESAFSGCTNLSAVSICDLASWCQLNIGYLDGNPLYYAQNLYLNGELLAGEIAVPEGVSQIGSYLFAFYRKLEHIIVPASVMRIGTSALLPAEGCEPCSVTYQGTMTQWLSVEGSFGSNVVSCMDGTLLGSGSCGANASWVLTDDGTMTISGTGSMTDYSWIGGSGWYDRRESIQSVAIEEGITQIGMNSFADCGNIASISLPGTLMAIKDGAFRNCANLRTLVFAGEAPDIGDSAFAGVSATAFYPAAKSSWTSDKMQNYGGNILWVPSCADLHTPVKDTAVSPTCTEGGFTEGSHCSSCGVVLVEQQMIAPLGHQEVIDAAVAPSCIEYGLTEGRHCARCGEILVAQETVPTAEHRFADGYCTVCGKADKADETLFGGKSLTLKVINPETGKAYTSKQIKWSLPEEYAPYATITAAGKLTAKKVVEKVRVEAIGTIVGDEEIQIIMTADIYPAVTQVEILEGEEVLNGKTVPVDFDEESRTFTVQAYPLDTAQEVTWSISDAKKSAYASYEINGSTLTVTNPKEKAGTVTIKATVNAGAKKTVSFKLNFSNFAEKVEITNTEETLTSGSSLQLNAVVTPDNVTKSGVTWSLKNAADKTYASISKTGVLKAKTVYRDTPVTVIATTKDGLQKAEYTVTITPKDTGMLILTLDGENVTKSILNIDLNTESALSLNAENLADGTSAEGITWKSSSNKIATVEDGMVLIHKKGNVTITAEEKVGKKVLRKATVTLKISALTSSITIEEPEDGLEVASGKAITLKATCEDGANKVTWSITEGSQYAKITNKGKLTANKDITSAKAVTVRATAADGSGVYEEVTVTIRPIAQGVQIYSEEGGRTLFSIRSSDTQWVRSNTTLEWAMNEVETLQLSARVYPCYEEGGRRNAIQGVTWKSSSTKIATVDEDGLVTCIKPGTVTITATAKDGSGKSVSFKLKVINKIESLSMEDQTVKGGKSINLLKLIEINPTDATYKTFDWEITGGDGAAYASINGKGVLKAKKVKTSMKVEIRVAAQDGSGKHAVFKVKITP